VSPEAILQLLDEIDTWCAREGIRDLDLVMIGGAAGTLVWSSPRMTGDLDVVVKGEGELARLEEVFGRETGREPWLDVVLAGIPRIPEGWRQRTRVFPGTWERLTVRHLSEADQIATKLRRFLPHDRRDIEFLYNLHPEVRGPLSALNGSAYWMEPDVWEAEIEPRRDRVLAFLDGRIRAL